MSANFSLGYWAQPLGRHWYGYTDHVDELPANPRNWVVQAYSDIALDIKRNCPEAYTVFLDFKSESAMEERISARHGQDAAEFAARMKHARYEKEHRGNFDFHFESNNHELIGRSVRDYALPKVVQTPNTSLISPGPLSDADVMSLLLDPNGIKVEGLNERTLQPHGWSIDLTLSPKYYRVSPHRMLKRVFDLSSGSEQNIAERFIEKTADNSGIYLKANEFILCSTQEKFTLPDNIVGLISGRSSYARMGVSVELSQIVIQPGHNDTVPLQVKNNLPYPIVVYPHTPIAQVVFFRTVSASALPYSKNTSAKYVGRLADIRSRYFDDPQYAEINKWKSPKRHIDWEHNLNVILFFLALSTVISWVISAIPNPSTSTIARTVGVVGIILTVLVLLAQGMNLATKRRR